MSSGPFPLFTPRGSSGGSGSNPIIAYVGFDLSTLAVVSGTYSRAGTTVTVTVANHGQLVGSEVFLDFTSGTAVDGTFTVVSVIDANNFTVTHGTSGATSGNVNLNRVALRGQNFGVQSVYRRSTGQATINFSSILSSATYQVILGGASDATGGANLVVAGPDTADPATITTAFFRLRAANPNDNTVANGNYMRVMVLLT